VGAGESLVSLMRQGRLDAAFSGNAGLGRAGAPTHGWQTPATDQPLRASELLTDAPLLEADWYHRTGIYPIHGLVVVRDAALARFPWLARELFDAFDASRRRYLQALAAGASDWESDGHYRAMAGLVGDPLPYGIEANRPALEALLRYCHEQGLLDRRPSVAEMFIDPMT
jgi:4,5-dihydroxyphthalate decarboxylase